MDAYIEVIVRLNPSGNLIWRLLRDNKNTWYGSTPRDNFFHYSLRAFTQEDIITLETIPGGYLECVMKCYDVKIHAHTSEFNYIECTGVNKLTTSNQIGIYKAGYYDGHSVRWERVNNISYVDRYMPQHTHMDEELNRINYKANNEKEEDRPLDILDLIG